MRCSAPARAIGLSRYCYRRRTIEYEGILFRECRNGTHHLATAKDVSKVQNARSGA